MIAMSCRTILPSAENNGTYLELRVAGSSIWSSTKTVARGLHKQRLNECLEIGTHNTFARKQGQDMMAAVMTAQLRTRATAGKFSGYSRLCDSG